MIKITRSHTMSYARLACDKCGDELKRSILLSGNRDPTALQRSQLRDLAQLEGWAFVLPSRVNGPADICVTCFVPLPEG